MSDFEAIGSDGDWSFREAIAKAFAGTIGIITALLVDYVQKGGESALFYGARLVNEYALSRFEVEAVSPIVYILLLVVAGFGMVYIFEPTNKRNAFYAGAGVLGFLATFSPVEETEVEFSPTITFDESIVEGPQAYLDTGAPVVRAAWRPFERRKSYEAVQARGLPVRVLIKFPATQSGDSLPRIYASLHDFNTDQTQKLGTGAKLVKLEDGPVIIYDLAITPGKARGSTLANLGLRVEATGYQIGYVEQDVTTETASPAVISIRMNRSNLPLAVERLRHPRKF